MSKESEPQIPEEFPKIIKDFILDMKSTFPEYQVFISKWWKEIDSFDHIEDLEERAIAMKKGQDLCLKFIFKFCLKKYPPRFFEILYQNNEIFTEDSEVDTEFLPYIHFKNLWQQNDLSDKTRETIWKYLQLILFSVVGSLNNREAFGDTAKLFDSINEDEFKGKLEETLDQMKGVFEGNGKDTGDLPQPNADHIHEHITGMLGGKLGQLAREIAEETAGDLNLDMEGATDVKDVFQNLFKNPGKLMGLVKNVGDKLDSRLKSGEIKESELMKEAGDIINKMKGMPGMGDIQGMLKKMGMTPPNGAKMDLNGMEAKLNQTIKQTQMKERMREKADMNRLAKELASREPLPPATQPSTPAFTDEQLLSVFDSKPSKKSKGKKGKK